MDPVSVNSDADVTTFEVQVYACQRCNSQPVSQCASWVKQVQNHKCFELKLLTRLVRFPKPLYEVSRGIRLPTTTPR